MDDFTINKLFVGLFLGCALIAVTSCQRILDPPLNTAALVGQDARFNCTIDRGSDGVTWSYVPLSGGSGEPIYNSYENKIYDDFVGHVEVDADDATDQLDLTVLSVEPSDAGIYVAGFILNEAKHEAEMVVLEQFQCQPTEGTEFTDGQEITFVCQVRYHGYKAPTLAWRDEDGVDLDFYMDHDPDDPELLTLKANRTASGDDHLQVFSCHLWFDVTEGDTTAPPTFSDQCSTHVNVRYRPDHVEFYPEYTGSVLDLYEGDHINCTGNGYPEPDYYWYCNGAWYGDSQTLEIDGDLLKGDSAVNTCNCSVRNYYDALDVGTSAAIMFNAYVTSSGGGGDDGLAAGAIAAAVIVPLVVVGLLIVLAIYIVMQRKKSAASKERPTSPDVRAQPLPQPRSRPPPDVQPGQRTVDPRSQGNPAMQYNRERDDVRHAAEVEPLAAGTESV